MTPASPQPAPPAARAPLRESAFDVYKGIAILAVILHHVSSVSIRHTMPHSTSHLAAVAVNRFLLFCVPAFLFLTVFLLSRSLLRRPMPPLEFWRKRFPRILLPYLIWSVFYAFYNVWTTVREYEDLQDSARWTQILLFGKAYYHLYFLVVVLQIYIVLPGLIQAARSPASSLRLWRFGLFLALALASWAGLTAPGRQWLLSAAPLDPAFVQWIGWAAIAGALYLLLEFACARGIEGLRSLWLWLLLAFGLQILAYWLHRAAIRSPYPATLLLSYFVPLLMGIWCAWHWDRFRQGWPRYRWGLGLLTLAALALFMPPAIRVVEEQPVNPLVYQVTYAAFTGFSLLWLFGLCLGISRCWTKASDLLAIPGTYSMELYLIHPALLTFINRYPLQGSPWELALYFGLLFVNLTVLSLLIAVLLRRIGLGEILFGR